MVMGMGMRSVWISLRAINYTDRAFRKAIQNIQNLTKEEQLATKYFVGLRQELMANVMAGMMFAAMGNMLISSLTNLMQETEIGASYLNDFNTSMEEFKIVMADSIFVVLNPALIFLKAFINIMKEHPIIARLVGLIGVMSGVVLIVYGAYQLLNSAMALNLVNAALQLTIGAEVNLYWGTHGLIIQGVTIAYWELALAMGAAVAGFALMYSIGMQLDSVISIVLGLAMAIIGLVIAIMTLKAILSGGTSLITDIGSIAAMGAIGGGIGALIAGFETFQMGTRALPYTGLFYGHRGEVVYNPSTDRPTGMGGDREAKTINNEITIDLSGSTLHTKADEETLVPLIKKTVRDAILDRD